MQKIPGRDWKDETRFRPENMFEVQEYEVASHSIPANGPALRSCSSCLDAEQMIRPGNLSMCSSCITCPCSCFSLLLHHRCGNGARNRKANRHDSPGLALRTMRLKNKRTKTFPGGLGPVDGEKGRVDIRDDFDLRQEV